MAAGKEYPTDRIRNVVVLGHGGSGKTSLVDALCFAAGSSKRRGSVDDGTALTMYTPEEIDHGVSIQCTPAHCDYQGTKINLLDTPGFMDFTGEVLAAVRVADAAVIVLGATSGVEVGTETVWEFCESRGLPRLFFVSMMDKEHADFEKVYRDIKDHLTEKVVPVEIPIGEGEDFRGIINLFSGRAHIYKPGTTTGEYEETDIPDELQGKFEEWETELQETLATTNEALLETYLEGGKISREEAIEAMALGMARGDVIPLFCGSAAKSYGMQALLRKLVELCPHPGETGGEEATTPDGAEVLVAPEDGEPFSALIFKTASEPHVGELSFFRVVSGTVSNGAEVRNAERGVTEKLNHLSIPMGRERLEVPRLHAGDIGVVAKLKDSHTNDTLSAPTRPVVLPKIEFPKPDIAVALRGVGRSDDDKLGEVLSRIHEEDPTFAAEFNPELHQTIARGLGELHIDVQIERMKRKYGVNVEIEQPRIAYRETITKAAEGQGRFKKQTGGRGQFGDCWIRLKPLPRGEGYRFVDSIKGGVIPSKYVPSVDKGIQEAAAEGILAGYPVVDFEAECYDGSYHSVDSSDIAFKVAGSMAFKKVAPSCRPVLLEPVIEVSVTTPDDYVGDIMSDLNQRRGKVLGMDPGKGRTTIRALVPEAELYKYATSLRSITQGRAHHTRAFHGYEPVPEHETQKLVAELKAQAEA
ncbi:MAG: elongation factor G [Gemmatimonadetes bacterium]|nr:MAG: elongation factor G [Gemmatimonadota bacterium]